MPRVMGPNAFANSVLIDLGSNDGRNGSGAPAQPSSNIRDQLTDDGEAVAGTPDSSFNQRSKVSKRS